MRPSTSAASAGGIGTSAWNSRSGGRSSAVSARRTRLPAPSAPTSTRAVSRRPVVVAIRTSPRAGVDLERGQPLSGQDLDPARARLRHQIGVELAPADDVDRPPEHDIARAAPVDQAPPPASDARHPHLEAERAPAPRARARSTRRRRACRAESAPCRGRGSAPRESAPPAPRPPQRRLARRRRSPRRDRRSLTPRLSELRGDRRRSPRA